MSGISKGTKVKWDWGQGTASGKVTDRFTKSVTRTLKGSEVTRNGSDDDPALLINLAVAHARRGDEERARDLFEAAMAHDERAELETIDGRWVDSRVLARKGLAMLARGEFASTASIASR